MRRNYTQETEMRRSERGGILAGLLITGLVIVCIAVAAGVIVARNIRISTMAREGGSDVSIDTPAGHLTVRAHEHDGWSAPDVPKYPGAYQSENHGGGAVVQWDSSTGHGDKGFSVSASEMITPDPASKVLEFYRNELPSWIVVKDNDGEARLELKEGGHKRIIGIHERHDGTHIGVASVGEPASN